MKTKHLSILALSTSVTLGGSLGSQTFAEDVREMSRAVAALDRFGLDIEIAVTDSAGKVLLRRRVESIRMGQRLLQRVDSIELLVTPQGTVMVDHARRRIAVELADSGKHSALPEVSAQLDAAFALLDSVRLISQSDSTREYRVYRRGSDASGRPGRADLLIDTRSHLPRILRYQYEHSGEIAGGATVTATYSWNRSPDADALRIERYVTLGASGHDVAPAPGFASYRLMPRDQ